MNAILLSSAEAAEALHVNRTKLQRLVRAGDLVPVVRGQGIRGPMFFEKTEVERFLRQKGALAASD